MASLRNFHEAIRIFDQTLQINPLLFEAYLNKG